MVAAVLVLVAIGGVGVGAVQWLQAPVAPPAEALPAVLLAAVPMVLGTGLPLAALAGVLVVLSRWLDEGAWLALQTSGLSGRALLPGLVLLGLAIGSVSFSLAHHLEPAARTTLREILREGLRPVAGRPLDLGAGMLVADHVDGDRLRGVLFASDADGLVGTAREARLEDDALVLLEGRAHAPGPPELAVRFEEARVPLARPGVRVELVERSTPRLGELVERMEARGRDAAYERAVLTKRTAWPVSAFLLTLLAAPLALRGRSGLAGVAVLAYWVLVRVCDGAAAALGGTLAGWAPTGVLALVTLVSWLRWRDR